MYDINPNTPYAKEGDPDYYQLAPCIVIAPKEKLLDWAKALGDTITLAVFVLCNDKIQEDVNTTLPDQHPVWVAPHGGPNRHLILTDLETFTHQFGRHACLEEPIFNTIICVDIEDYVDTPAWDNMNLDKEHAYSYLLCCQHHPDPASAFLPMLSTLENRRITLTVHGLVKQRRYDPTVDPYTLELKHPAAVYRYCREGFEKWVLNNPAITEQEKKDRVLDVFRAMVVPQVFD